MLYRIDLQRDACHGADVPEGFVVDVCAFLAVLITLYPRP